MLTKIETQNAKVKEITSRPEGRSIPSSLSSTDDPVKSSVRPESRREDLQDSKVNVKIVLSSLWVSMMFVFAYVDIFGYLRADVINGALNGKVPVSDFKINQTFLTIITLYIIIPSLMVVFSLVAPARINRPANIVASLIYAATVVASMIGEKWTYYLLGSAVEVLLLLNLARVAWTWPRLSVPRSGLHV
jgi:Family of unknown function (DUF6326)